MDATTNPQSRPEDPHSRELRDRFAAAAVTGLLLELRGEWTAERIADEAFRIADAMLAARSANRSPQ